MTWIAGSAVQAWHGLLSPQSVGIVGGFCDLRTWLRQCMVSKSYEVEVCTYIVISRFISGRSFSLMLSISTPHSVLKIIILPHQPGALRVGWACVKM